MCPRHSPSSEVAALRELTGEALFSRLQEVLLFTSKLSVTENSSADYPCVDPAMASASAASCILSTLTVHTSVISNAQNRCLFDKPTT